MLAGNRTYAEAADMPAVIPVFPLSGALLLPGGQLPLNIFEPRYLEMVETAMADDRIIGMIQPASDKDEDEAPELRSIGCAGRITAWAETGDGRYLITLSGIARFRVVGEVASDRLFRQCRVSFDDFADDFEEGDGESSGIDRAGLLKTLRDYLDAHEMRIDWDSVDKTPTDELVNALAMMSPYGDAEKQALLEAPSLRARAETLMAITEASLARGSGKAALN
jgi:Lon protease-like protein